MIKASDKVTAKEKWVEKVAVGAEEDIAVRTMGASTKPNLGDCTHVNQRKN